MNRREFIVASAAASALAGTSAAASEPDFKGIAREAYLYSLPLIEMETVRTRLIANGGAQNTIYARRMLADHTSRGVMSPNNDTLYASAWLEGRLWPPSPPFAAREREGGERTRSGARVVIGLQP